MSPARRYLILFSLIVVLGIAWGSGNLAAQSVEGTLRGRVRDASGAVVTAATVRARDAEKGLLYPTQTDSLGLFQIALPPGRYELTVDAQGFATTRETGIALSLGQTLALDFILQVSDRQESIVVKAPAPLVDTASGTLSALVDRERLQQLPLNGRDFGHLALLQPGVVANPNGANAPYGGKWANFVVNGQIDQGVLFLMDGTEINDIASGRTPSGSSGLLLGLDAVQEFQVLLNGYKAEFGKNSGGVIHVATRSGTNQLHGSLFEFLRNSVLDARNFFDRRASPSEPRLPPFRRNQFGASLGGPIRRDRTFFFLNYEGLRERKGITAVATVPTAEARSAAVPAVVPFLNLYPLPNGPVNPDGRTASLTSSILQPAREDFGLLRVDHRLGERTTVMGRLSIQDSLVTPPFPSTPVPGFPQDLPHRNTYSMIGLTTALGTNAVNAFHFAFNRTYGAIELPPPPNGLTISPVPGRDFGLIIVSGISNLGTQTFVPRATPNLFEIANNFSSRRGRHSQKYGVSVQRYRANELRGTFFNGQYTFAGLDPFLAGTPTIFIGVLGGTAAAGPASPAGWRWTSYNLYAQDDMEILPRLTLNLGIRYEFSTSPTEVNGQLANLRSPLDPQITYGGQLFNTMARSFAPRFGFAWSPSSRRQAVLRGGYGIFFNPLVVNMWANSRLVPPFVETKSIPAAPFPNPLATGRTPVASTTGQSIEYDLSQPYSQQWNLQWQQAVAAEWVAKAGYVGSRTLHLIRSLEANAALPVVVDGKKFFPANSPRRNPNFAAIRGRTSDGNSWYNALQVTLERRFSSAWGFQSSYTWGKSLSTNESSFHTFPSQSPNSQDPDDLFLDKGRSAFDVRHRFVTNFLFQVPQLTWSNPWNRLVSGWHMSAIASFSSGYPFSVVDGFNRSRNLQTDPIADRPDLLSGARYEDLPKGVSRGCGNIPAGTPVGTPNLWFDPCAFTLQPAGYYGNVARNALTGPGFANVDLSWSKTFSLSEEQTLEFRADFFNIFNHPNFSTPRSPTGAQVTGGVIVFPSPPATPDTPPVRAGNAGQIFSTVNDSRQIQFSLRYRF